jgi:hypothetical protein
MMRLAMDGPPNEARSPVAEVGYFRLRLVLRDGYAGEFEDLARSVWGDIPEVLRCHGAVATP